MQILLIFLFIAIAFATRGFNQAIPLADLTLKAGGCGDASPREWKFKNFGPLTWDTCEMILDFTGSRLVGGPSLATTTSEWRGSFSATQAWINGGSWSQNVLASKSSLHDCVAGYYKGIVGYPAQVKANIPLPNAVTVNGVRYFYQDFGVMDEYQCNQIAVEFGIRPLNPWEIFGAPSVSAVMIETHSCYGSVFWNFASEDVVVTNGGSTHSGYQCVLGHIDPEQWGCLFPPSLNLDTFEITCACDFCQNSKHCIVETGECICLDGFYGDVCAYECDACVNGICNNSLSGDGSCTCDDGFYGEICDQECSCVNGECNDGVAGDGTCTCHDDYFGDDCTVVCDCIHGLCNDGLLGDGSCLCEENYFGLHCEANCTSCINGECDDGANGTATCVCEDGFYGTVCDGSCNCVNGECNDGALGDGSCQCEDGFYGELCDKECECEYGECDDGPFGDGSCTCDPNYFGPTCSQECTCVNGKCLDGAEGDGTCEQCFNNFYGADCSDECDCGSKICSAGIAGNGTCSSCADTDTNCRENLVDDTLGNISGDNIIFIILIIIAGVAIVILVILLIATNISSSDGSQNNHQMEAVSSSQEEKKTRKHEKTGKHERTERSRTYLPGET